MEDLPLRDLEQEVEGEKKITNKLPEVAGDGLDLKIVQNGTLGEKMENMHSKRRFFSVVQVFFLPKCFHA